MTTRAPAVLKKVFSIIFVCTVPYNFAKSGKRGWLKARSKMESGHKFLTANLMLIMIVGVNYGQINIAT